MVRDGMRQVSAVRVVVGLGACAMLLSVAGLLGQVSRYLTGHDNVFGLVPMLDADREFNLPSLFSVALLSATSGLLFIVARLEPPSPERRALYWRLLGAGFLLMAIDEWLSVHEMLIPLLRSRRLPRAFHFAWVTAALPLVAALGAVFFRFWWRLPAPTRHGTAAAAALYLGGTLGMEMVGGLYASAFGERTLAYAAIVAVEELCEMSGVVLMIGVLLAHAQRLEAPLSIPGASPAVVVSATSREWLAALHQPRRER